MRVLYLLLRQQLQVLHYVSRQLARMFARQLVQMQVQLMELVLPVAKHQERQALLALAAV
jgi:hypothetical protein